MRGGAPVDVHFCPKCTKILALGRQGDYFSFLGVARKLNLDARCLEQNFRTLSRQFHPDYFYNATPTERRASLERSSYLNDAYRTLKQPASRVAYLLEVEGALQPADHEAGKKVPASLLEEVFALNEELDEVRDMRNGDAPRSAMARAAGRGSGADRRQARRARIAAAGTVRPVGRAGRRRAGGRAAVLAALRERVLERNYINNLLATIEREATGMGGPQL